MTEGLYTVFDKKSGAYNTPYFSINDHTAARAFNHLAAAPDSIVAANPEDYALYRIGFFDDDSGLVRPESAPVWIANVKPRN